MFGSGKREANKKKSQDPMSKVLEQTPNSLAKEKKEQDDVTSPFDRLDQHKESEQVEEEEELLSEETKELGVEKMSKTADSVSVKYDFRTGVIPEGVQVVHGQNESSLQYQADGSSYLKLSPGSHLLLKLNLPPNGGSFVNDYTITMDVMIDTYPKDSISLYQANWEQRKGEGDAFIFNSGGVGIFGEHGVKECWVKEKKWTRYKLFVVFSLN